MLICNKLSINVNLIVIKLKPDKLEHILGVSRKSGYPAYLRTDYFKWHTVHVIDFYLLFLSIVLPDRCSKKCQPVFMEITRGQMFQKTFAF